MQSEFVTKINLNSDEQISEIQNQLLILEEKISSIKKNNKEVDQLVNNFKETINDLVDQKLVDVYKNFQSVVSKLVTDEVEKIRINIEANANKLKPAQIAIYKEMGLSIEHIIELKKSNLI
jgi:4-hydroxyphenylpyruvate dioxygenase-like putative hemolysin